MEETVTHRDSQEIRNRVFYRLIEFLKAHGGFSAECVYQNDELQMAAPEFFAELVEKIIKFKVDKNPF